MVVILVKKDVAISTYVGKKYANANTYQHVEPATVPGACSVLKLRISIRRYSGSTVLL